MPDSHAFMHCGSYDAITSARQSLPHVQRMALVEGVFGQRRRFFGACQIPLFTLTSMEFS
jgi:hypothetical protein